MALYLSNNDGGVKAASRMRTSAKAVEDWFDREAKRFPASFIVEARRHLIADMVKFVEEERTKSYVRGFRAGQTGLAEVERESAA